MLRRVSGAAVVCVGLWWSQAGCRAGLVPTDGGVPSPPPPAGGGGPADGSAGAPADASSSADGADASPSPPPLRVAGACDLELRPTRTWEAPTGTLPAPGPYRPCAVVGGQLFATVVVSADGRRAAGIGAGGQVQVLDARSLAPLGTFMRARGAYQTIALSGDGARVAAGGGRDGELDVWSVDDHALLAVADLGTTWPGTDGPVALSVGGAFAAMSNGSAIVVIDLASGAQRRYADSADSSGLAFVDGDRKLAVAHYGFSLTGGGYGALSLLDLASGAFTELFHDPDYNVVEQMLASADGRTIITSGTRVRVWDAATGAQLADRQSDGNDLLGVTADGGQFVTHVSVGATVHLQYRRTSDGAVTNEVLVAPLTDTRWSWGGDLLLMSQPFPLENVPIVVAVDLSARSVLARACSPVHADISGFSQDGERLVSWPSRSAFVFDARTGAPIFPGVEPTVDVWQVVLSPDGRNLAWTVLSPGRDGTGPLNVVLADVDRRTTATLAGQRSVRLPYGGAVAFSADSTKLVVFDEGEEILDVFDVATKTLLAEQALPFSNGFLLGFTPDGQGLRIYSDRAVQIVSWRDGATRPGWPPNGDFPSSSVDARTLVAGDQDGAALYRDEVLVASLPIPSDRCVGPSWIFRVSPGGGVASVSHDCGRPWMSSVGPYLEIFDAATGAELQTIHQEIVPAFSWDGSQFADGNTLWCR